MLDRRQALLGLAAGTVAVAETKATLADAPPAEAQGIQLASPHFNLEIDQQSGAILSITHPDDAARMSWVGGSANAPWQPAGSAWGLGYADLGESVLHRSRWQAATVRRTSQNKVLSTYRSGALVLEVSRELANDHLVERYRFTNTGTSPLPMRKRSKDALAIYTPFNDHYTSTADVLEHRCHAHVWTGGASSWVAMFRMGGRSPHLGLVLNEGALDGYSVQDRDLVTLSNTRGTFLVHPAVDALEPGASTTITWTLFWHDGWEDFLEQAQRRSSQFVRIEASRWVTFANEKTELHFTGALASPSLSVGKTPIALGRTANGWTATLPPSEPGERVVMLSHGKGATSTAVIHTVSNLETLMAARATFIASRQQWHEAGSARDGAYVVYDNQFDVMAKNETSTDRNDGRERLGMGVFLARWLRQKGNVPAVRSSLERYYRFVGEQLQRPDGYVLDGIGRETKRLYNWPWVAQLHVAMARLTGDARCWDAALKTLKSYYDEGGIEFYAIGLPVLEMLRELEKAGRKADREQALALFTRHGNRMLERGTAYPASEVNFEQSIVAPAAIFLLELHLATGDPKWLKAATPHTDLLQLFEGRQPDHHLNGISIRHWDGYWFGKARMWGDTFPHYWSSLNALAWHHLGKATKEVRWQQRAEIVMRGNLSLFTEDGRGSAAFIFPTTVDGRPGHFADQYANDQDWAFVHALQMAD